VRACVRACRYGDAAAVNLQGGPTHDGVSFVGASLL
jgi:hypothetical protein